MSDVEQQETGTLVAHVLRDSGAAIYLDHDGAPEELELDSNVSPGGDWEEANVYFEDGPPMPPKEDGYYRLILPWRRVTSNERLESGDDLCCRYTAKPIWEAL